MRIDTDEETPAPRGERAAIRGAIRLLGASLGLKAAVVERALDGESSELLILRKESEDMAFVAAALRRLGEAVRDAHVRVVGDVFITNILRGEPYRGDGTKLDACDHPEALREVLARGVPVAFDGDRSLLVWKRGLAVEVWETAPRGKPSRHPGVLAWLTQSAPTLHVVP